MTQNHIAYNIHIMKKRERGQKKTKQKIPKTYKIYYASPKEEKSKFSDLFLTFLPNRL